MPFFSLLRIYDDCCCTPAGSLSRPGGVERREGKKKLIRGIPAAGDRTTREQEKKNFFKVIPFIRNAGGISLSRASTALLML